MKTLSITFSKPVVCGSVIKVKTNQPVLAVTDNAGNTYTQVSKNAKKWIAHNCVSGPLTITAIQPTSELILEIEEHI